MSRILYTLKLCCLVFKVRTFGKYRHSTWDGVAEYSVYGWNGETYYIPCVRTVQ
jgi:hypothetical protein